MGFINTNNLPPMGYQIFESRTGWSSTPYTGLEATVMEVQRHRESNKGRFPDWPLDRGSIEQFVLQFTEARLRLMPGGDQWLSSAPAAAPPENFHFPPRRPRAAAGNSVVGALTETIKNTVAGIGLWLEWFGDSPVAQELANDRASTCARCPINERDGNALQRFNEIAAKEITEIFGSLKQMKLSTPHDDMLGVCGACDCPMKAKVFSPLHLITKHLRPEARAKLDQNCWIPVEEKEAQENPVQQVAEKKH